MWQGPERAKNRAYTAGSTMSLKWHSAGKKCIPHCLADLAKGSLAKRNWMSIKAARINGIELSVCGVGELSDYAMHKVSHVVSIWDWYMSESPEPKIA